MARYPGAQRGVVGANVSIVRRDIEAPDQDEVGAVTDRGQREQSEHTDHDEFALARFRRRIGGGGEPARPFARCHAPRRGDAWLLPRRESATGPQAARCLGCSLILRRFRSTADDACGLISRCGHYPASPFEMSRCAWDRGNRPQWRA